jgi:tetratricopeptide (TPR) repeat protein
MFAALRAQKNGRSAEAAETYRRVLAVDPDNYDATHLLGILEYEHGRSDDAMALLRRAIELKPGIGAARHNLRLFESMPLIEREICLDVLPRLLSRVDPVSDIEQWAAGGELLRVVIADDIEQGLQQVLDALLRLLGRSSLSLWAEPGVSFVLPGVRSIDAAAGNHPEGGSLVFFGAGRSPVAWLSKARPDRILIVLVREEPCAAIDRIDEIASLCRTRPGLICATRALAERLRLPQHAIVATKPAGLEVK